MLTVQGISVFHGDIQALFDVSLRIQEKEIVALLGANGAGKTTLINALSGLNQPRYGTITFDNLEIQGLEPFQIVELGLIQIPEGRMLFPDMTVLENLEMGAYSSSARQVMNKTLGWVFELFPRLKVRTSQLAGTLSGGEQQMLAIGRGLMSTPKLLMLDEPSLGLAPILVIEVFDIIKEINRHGVTVMLVEQNAIQALEVSHRAYVLETGRITLHGDAADLLGNEYVRKSYLGI